MNSAQALIGDKFLHGDEAIALCNDISFSNLPSTADFFQMTVCHIWQRSFPSSSSREKDTRFADWPLQILVYFSHCFLFSSLLSLPSPPLFLHPGSRPETPPKAVRALGQCTFPKVHLSQFHRQGGGNGQ